eukprot:7622718-Prorocentrum_lima.AAC.1
MLYHWGLGIGKGVRLAKRNMPINEFLACCEQKYVEEGQRLKGVKVDSCQEQTSHMCILLRKLCCNV